MSILTEYQKMGWRILYFSGQVPLFPNSKYSDEWTSNLMINKGQIAINIIDKKFWFCSDTQIVEISGGGGGSGVVYIRRSDYTTLISYNGYALTGSLETDAVWTITKIVTDSAGDVISSVQTENYKWSERYSL